MITFAKKAALGLALGATAMTAAAVPAQAQRYRHDYYRHHDNGAGTAIVAGIAGLAIGAAIASSNNDRRYDYDRRYYRGNGYYPSDGYYARRYYRDYPQCRVRRVWDPYLERRVRVRVCR
tara:strand:+ start:764 stop:1123 length:360 start_codon:yes stop_codon:yes gene_type:complete